MDKSKSVTPSFATHSPSKENWISAGAGKNGFSFNYVIRMKDAQVELYIDTGEASVNKRLYDQLYSQKENIEKTFEKNLDWQKLDEKRACRVRYVFPNSGLLEREKWPGLQKQMIDAMANLQNAFQNKILNLK